MGATANSLHVTNNSNQKQTHADMKIEETNHNKAVALTGIFSADADTPSDLLNTPFEANSKASFTRFNTGTLSTEITPEMVNACAALRALQLTAELKKLSCAVAQIQASFETSGFPTRLVKPGEIASEFPNVISVEDFSDEFLKEASAPIEMLDTMACIEGVPIWDRLPGERVDFFNTFKLYRDSRYFMLDDGSYIVSNRTIAGLARDLKIPAVVLTYVSKLYCWLTRCKCYDAYMEQSIQRRKTQEVAMLQSDHTKIAKKLCDKAIKYLSNNFDNMQPKEVLQALELGIKYGRVSAGLLGDKPGTTSGTKTNFSFVQNTTNNAEQMLQVNAPAPSVVEQQLQEDIKQEDNLLSILHILQASGAMKTAIHSDLIASGDEGLDIIDSDEEVE